MNDQRVMVRWIGSTATLALVLLWLERLGRGELSAPPLSLGDAASWLEQRDTATAAFALMRLLAMGFGGYLLLVIVIGGAARALRLAQAIALIDRCTVPFARTVFGGVALLGAMAAPPPLAPQAHDSMVELPAEPSASDGQATLHLLPDGPTTTAPTSTTTTTTVATPAAPAIAPDAPNAPDASADPHSIDDNNTWIVQHGESFWSIAQMQLDEAHGGHAEPRAVDAYWRELIELNRSRLANGDPDLLYRGQEIELPAVAIG